MSKILLVIMLTTFLSCTSTEIEPFQDYQYRTVFKKIDIAGEEFISIKDSICEKRKYRVWTDKVGALELFRPVKIEECLMLFGFKAKATTDLWVLQEYVRQEISNQ